MQAKKIISNLKKEGIIPLTINIEVIAGTPTSKEHLNDGRELLSEKKLSVTSTIEFADAASIFLSDFLLNNPTEEKRAYLGLRSMQDLIKACKGLTDEKFHHVDFLGTLSFNVRSACTTVDDCKKFVRILERFNQALCYEGFHSAKAHSSTATAWKNFRPYLLSNQGESLRKAGAYWNEGNIRYCIDLLLNSNFPGNKVNVLELTEEQIQKARPLFETALQQANSAQPFEPNRETFETTIIALLGINNKSLEAQIAFNSFFTPFCNMVFNSPEICLADVAMTALLCHQSLLEKVRIHKRLNYKETFSVVTDYNLLFIAADSLWQDNQPDDTIEISPSVTGFKCRMTEANGQVREFNIDSFNVEITDQNSLDENKKSVLETLAGNHCIANIAYVVMNDEQLSLLEEYTIQVLTRSSPLEEERLRRSYAASHDLGLLATERDASTPSDSCNRISSDNNPLFRFY